MIYLKKVKSIQRKVVNITKQEEEDEDGLEEENGDGETNSNRDIENKDIH